MSSLRGDKRREFPLSVRKLAFARCCKNGTQPGVPQCENCGIVLKSGNIEYEHLLADGLGGEPTLENCGVWCRSSCSKTKTHREDNPRMQKADRVTKKAFGLTRAKPKIMSPGFVKADPQRSASRPIKKRAEYRGYKPCSQKLGARNEQVETTQEDREKPVFLDTGDRALPARGDFNRAVPLTSAHTSAERGA